MGCGTAFRTRSRSLSAPLSRGPWSSLPRADAVLLFTAVLGLTACSYRLAEPSLGLSRDAALAIVTLENDSNEPGLELLVTDALRREFLRRGSLDVVETPTSADWVLSGRVADLEVRAESFSSVVLALEHRVTMQLELSLLHRDGRRIALDSDMLQDSELVLASADLEAGRKNRREVLRKLSSQLAGRVHDALYGGELR
ncbi:MAG: LPS assembly lipoprotein LptE [Proteobacteria bacterium]|nr:LPS assembly lipoprotein LptE [Pseudomonadota bacterium]